MNPTTIIKDQIKDRGIKITALAAKAGMSKDALSKSLRGKRQLQGQELLNICSVLGLELTDFEESDSSNQAS